MAPLGPLPRPAVETGSVLRSASVNDGGFIVDGEITRDTRPALNGYAGRGVTLECYHHGELVGSTLSDAQTGYFSFTLPDALAGGSRGGGLRAQRPFPIVRCRFCTGHANRHAQRHAVYLAGREHYANPADLFR